MNKSYQELFDIGLLHIRKQGRPALRRNGTGFCCAYYAHGDKCIKAG